MNPIINSLNALAEASGGDPHALRDIKPPVAIPDYLFGILIAAALLILVGILIASLFWWLQRRPKPTGPPPIPAHLRARQRLGEALALIAEPKLFCTAVSDVIRFYLEERFDFRAPERTTEEFLHELRATNLLLPDQKASLGEFLSRCDLVKFARYEPGESELRDLHVSAVRLVDETEPAPEPAGVTAAPVS
jgi:hypothetical protein